MSARCGPGAPSWRRQASKCAWLAVMLLTTGAALAQGHPFGQPEASMGWQPGGWLGSLLGQVSIWQSHFYRQLTGAVRAWQQDGHAAWTLIGLSFAYGVFHAVGPGHGKAVISAYVLANRQTVRNGAVLALLSAMMQGLVAIVLVGIAAWVLNLTGAAMNRATLWLEIGSYALVTLLGMWLAWTKVVRPLRSARDTAVAPDRHGAHGHGAAQQPDSPPHGHRHGLLDGHPHGPGCGCGHAHVAPPALAEGRLDLAKAASAVMSVGLRPCSGALIVLVFALSQGFFAAGAAAAMAMGLGTGVTVASLTCLALAARHAAGRLSGNALRAARIHRGLEGLAALAVLALGILLLGGAWTTAGLWPLGGG